MFYSFELDKVTSRLNDRPALQLVHQATGGEFVASDGLIMLIDAGSATSCLSPWWRLQMPVTPPASPEPLDGWQAVLSRMKEAARRRWQLDRVTYAAGLARVNNLLVSERYFKIALEFIGPEAVLLIPKRRDSAVLLHNADESRTALIMPYALEPEDIKRAKWDVLDDSGTIIYTTKNLPEAESFGFTVRLHK